MARQVPADGKRGLKKSEAHGVGGGVGDVEHGSHALVAVVVAAVERRRLVVNRQPREHPGALLHHGRLAEALQQARNDR